jgi:hypothetical protein
MNCKIDTPTKLSATHRNMHCTLHVSNLKNSSAGASFTTWVSPEWLISVMAEYYAIGWRTMEVEWSE